MYFKQVSKRKLDGHDQKLTKKKNAEQSLKDKLEDQMQNMSEQT